MNEKGRKEMELANATEKEISVIDGLAMQARALRLTINTNMLQLGGVFAAAKPLVEPGKWTKWLEENADVSVRTAQDMIAAYKRFGDKPQFAGLGSAKTFRLLPLPEGSEERFMETHDVENMSVREVQEAVKQAREEERAKARESMEALQASNLSELAKQKENMQVRFEEILAEKEAENREETRQREEDINALTEKIRTWEKTEEELRKKLAEAEESAKEATQAAIDGTQDIRKQNAAAMEEARKLRREIEEKDELLKELQEEYNQVNALYLDAQSAIAKGDAERTTADILSAGAVGDAVRMFIGQVGRLPFMHKTFAMMDLPEREEYRTYIGQVLEWASRSLAALETVEGNGGIIE